MFCTKWAALGLAVVSSLASFGSVHAAPLFFEDFEGYASFPTVVNTYFGVPAGHPTSGTVQERINGGLPLLSEGAEEIWYGARFEDLSAGNGTVSGLNGDLAVQNYGSINRPDDPYANYTHVGRFEDDAGLVFHLDTTGMGSVVLSFDWRTYNVESGDVVRVGHRSGNPGFGSCTGAGESGCFTDLRTGPGAWSSWNALTLSDANPKGNNNSWLRETFALPGNTADLWVAFWLDNGEGDIGKIDNITVTGISITPVPVPAAAWLLISGLAWMLFGMRRRTTQEIRTVPLRLPPRSTLAPRPFAVKAAPTGVSFGGFAERGIEVAIGELLIGLQSSRTRSAPARHALRPCEGSTPQLYASGRA